MISCLGTDGDDTLSTAMAHILSVMEEQHIKRLITIGTAGILDSRYEPGKYRFETNESKRKQTRAAKEHAKVYEMLKESSLDWTIICPLTSRTEQQPAFIVRSVTFCLRAAQAFRSAILRTFYIVSSLQVSMSETVSDWLIDYINQKPKTRLFWVFERYAMECFCPFAVHTFDNIGLLMPSVLVVPSLNNFSFIKNQNLISISDC